MGNQKKHHWSVEEEKALRDGVAKHGVGKWKLILTDPQFAFSFINRSNVDLKDKWRNIASASTSSGTSPKSNDPGFWYQKMIFESLSSTNNADGLDLNEIRSYIQERDIEDVIPEQLKRYLKRKLWKLVKQGKLEKNDGRYKIKHYEQNNNRDDDHDAGGNDEQQTEEREKAAAASFASSFINRSNVDLKDKWCNLAGASTSISASPIINNTCLRMYRHWIFEALSSTHNANGLYLNEIHSYIQERGEGVIPEHLRRYLKRKLWKLFKQGKLEKNDGRYKIKHYEQNNKRDDDDDDHDGGGNDEQLTEEEAALDAAYKIAAAEKEEGEMMEAIRKRDKLAELLEKSKAMLALAEEISKKCARDGVVYI